MVPIYDTCTAAGCLLSLKAFKRFTITVLAGYFLVKFIGSKVAKSYKPKCSKYINVYLKINHFHRFALAQLRNIL